METRGSWRGSGLERMVWWCWALWRGLPQEALQVGAGRAGKDLCRSECALSLIARTKNTAEPWRNVWPLSLSGRAAQRWTVELSLDPFDGRLGSCWRIDHALRAFLGPSVQRMQRTPAVEPSIARSTSCLEFRGVVDAVVIYPGIWVIKLFLVGVSWPSR